MYLLILIIIFILIGYLLAESPIGKKIDDTAIEVSEGSKKLRKDTAKKTRSLFNIETLFERFDALFNTTGIDIFPNEFVDWYTNLSSDESEEFTQSLSAHMKTLGFRLKELVDGSLDEDPYMRQVFVETIVVYSHEFQKVKQAREKTEKQNKKNTGMQKDQKEMAKKRPSRRKDNEVSEVDLVDSASAV